MASNDNTLSAAEVKFLGQAWQCSRTNLATNIDMDKLSKLAGHTNVGSTRNLLARITKKLKESAAETADITGAPQNETTSAPSTPAKGKTNAKIATPSSKRKATKDSAEDEGDAADTPAPSHAKKQKLMENIKEEDHDDSQAI